MGRRLVWRSIKSEVMLEGSPVRILAPLGFYDYVLLPVQLRLYLGYLYSLNEIHIYACCWHDKTDIEFFSVTGHGCFFRVF